MKLGLYTLANSTQLSLLNSVASTMGTGVAATGNNSLFFGPRQIQILSSQWSAVPAFSRTHYWLGLHFRSSGFGIPVDMSGFFWMYPPSFSGHIGVGNTNSTASLPFPCLGVYRSSFTTALPGSIAFSQVGQAPAFAGAMPSVIIHNIGA